MKVQSLRSIALTAVLLAGTALVPVSQASAVTETEFDGFGINRSAFLALRDARNNARQQATAAGFSVCRTGFEDSGFDPGLHAYFGESDLFCTE